MPDFPVLTISVTYFVTKTEEKKDTRTTPDLIICKQTQIIKGRLLQASVCLPGVAREEKKE